MPWDEIARNQDGIVRRSQLLASGHSAGAIDHALRSGRLLATRFEGVFRVEGAPLDEGAITWMTVLGARAVLSFVTAGLLWGIPVRPDGWIHVTRRERSRFDRRAGLRVHRTALAPTAVTTLDGLPITTRVETILDCVGWIQPDRAGSVLDRAMQQGWIGVADVQRRLDEQPGRWGNRRIAELMRALMPGAEAESERMVHRILRGAGITGWVGNLAITLDGERFRIDIAFPELEIAIEVEGWAFHRTKERRDNDLAKLNALQRNGWRCLVFSYDHVCDPPYILAEINALLAAAPRP